MKVANQRTSALESKRRTRDLRLAALVGNGFLVGASLDQSLKQLPARKTIGAVAYSRYSQAADLGNGIPFYSALGIGAAGLTIAAGLKTGGKAAKGAAILSALHSFVTTKAAPIEFSQRDYVDEQSLSNILARFERWQTPRVSLQVATLAMSALALRGR
jgi:hypothetical protein